jgi:dienelactone hydrolase
MIRKFFLAALAVFAVALITGLALKAWGDRHFYDGYNPTLPLNPETAATEKIDTVRESFGAELPARYRRTEFSFEARPGERVPCVMTQPLEKGGPYPAIVFLHGSHQDKEFVEDICTPFNEAGFVMISYDQHMRGGRKYRGSAVGTGLAFRERSWKTVHDTRRLLDYLETRSDIDAKRLYLIGASYGAITGTPVVAQDKRIKAAVLVVGGGNLSLMTNSPVVRDALPGWLAALAGPMISFLAGASDPIHHAPQTAGTPVLMQNGSLDRVIIPETGEALFAALGEPKELRWYPIDHPDQRKEDGPEILRLLNEGLAWLIEQDKQQI